MKNKIKNYAFIDSQNLNLGIQELGWKLDFRRFRIYLKEKYKVEKAYLFIGYVAEHSNMYRALQEYGYIVVFKPIIRNNDGEIKGNVDADLVLRAMIDFDNYDKAIIVTSDGDFYCLAAYLREERKLEKVLSPHIKTCSVLLKTAAKEKIVFMDNLKKKLEYKKKKHRLRTEP